MSRQPDAYPNPSNLSSSTARVWLEICQDPDAAYRDLFVRCRPISHEGLRRALDQLADAGLISKEEFP